MGKKGRPQQRRRRQRNRATLGKEMTRDGGAGGNKALGGVTLGGATLGKEMSDHPEMRADPTQGGGEGAAAAATASQGAAAAAAATSQGAAHPCQRVHPAGLHHL